MKLSLLQAGKVLFYYLEVVLGSREEVTVKPIDLNLVNEHHIDVTVNWIEFCIAPTELKEFLEKKLIENPSDFKRLSFSRNGMVELSKKMMDSIKRAVARA